jgi:hypothetical protein
MGRRAGDTVLDLSVVLGIVWTWDFFYLNGVGLHPFPQLINAIQTSPIVS